MDSSAVRRRRPMPVASSPAPSSAMPGTSRPVRGSSPVAVAEGVAEGVVVAGEVADGGGVLDTGGWVLSDGWFCGPLAWCFVVLRRALAVVCVLAFEPPKGSVY